MDIRGGMHKWQSKLRSLWGEEGLPPKPKWRSNDDTDKGKGRRTWNKVISRENTRTSLKKYHLNSPSIGQGPLKAKFKNKNHETKGQLVASQSHKANQQIYMLDK